MNLPYLIPSLATLGLLGACGPLPAAMNDTDATGSATATATGNTAGNTEGATDGSATEGTASTTQGGDPTSATSQPTTGVTSGPEPECKSTQDCAFDEFCVDGHCEYYGGCGTCCEGDCNYSDTDGPYYECFRDPDCADGYVCEFGRCVMEAIVLPACPAAAPDGSQFGLTQIPSALGLGDVDGDGDLDLFAALPAVAAIELAFNDGAGVFTPGEVIPLGAPQTDLRVAGGDLDGDGDLDLAVARPDGGEVVLLLNQAGTFTPGPSLPASAPPRAIAVDDLDGDGDQDVMTFGNALTLGSVWVGDGVGGFAPEKIVLDVVDEFASTVQRVDGDDRPDLLVLSVVNAPGNLSVYRGTVDASWQFGQGFGLDTSASTQALAGDLGLSPARELVVLSGGEARVFGGVEGVGWSSPVTYKSTSPLAAGLFIDGDGDASLDLVSATGGPTIAVLLGDGQGGFACERSHDVSAVTVPELMAVGDVDGLAGSELVVGDRDGPAVRVLSGL